MSETRYQPLNASPVTQTMEGQRQENQGNFCACLGCTAGCGCLGGLLTKMTIETSAPPAAGMIVPAASKVAVFSGCGVGAGIGLSVFCCLFARDRIQRNGGWQVVKEDIKKRFCP